MTSTGPTCGTTATQAARWRRRVVDVRGREVAEPHRLDERARDYPRSSKAANTLRADESGLRQFGVWCQAKTDRGG